MKLLRIAFIAVALPLAASVIHPLRVSAQTDHLICYKMSDPLKFPAAAATTADLLAELQPDFTQQGCTIVKPVEFCVPAAKSNVQNPPAPLLDIPGQSLSNDYICYQAKCPRRVGARRVEDQFGIRIETGYQPTKVCVPAQKLIPTCDQSTYPKCGGTCADGTPCQKDTASKMCTCGGSQPCEGSKPDKFGICSINGCPADQTCKIEPTTSGPALCHCVPLPPPACPGSVPQTAADGSLTCGERSCPNPNDRCVVLATPSGTFCTCQPVEQGCTGSTAAECTTHTCTDPNFICTLVGTQCRCEPPPQDCAPNVLAGGQCPAITNCPPPQTCKFVPTTGGIAGGTCQCQ